MIKNSKAFEAHIFKGTYARFDKCLFAKLRYGKISFFNIDTPFLKLLNDV